MYYPVHKKDPYFSAYPLLKSAGYAGDIDAINDPEVYKLLSEKLSFTNEQTEDAILATVPFESYEYLYGMFFENTDVFEKHEYEELNGDLYPRELVCEDDIDEQAFSVIMREQLFEVLGTLTEREQKVIELRYGLRDGTPKTLEEVGFAFNVTRERVRQIEAKALRKLRHPSRSRKLKDYIDFMPTIKSEEEE